MREYIQTGSEQDKTSHRHEKNLQKAVWWGRNRDCGWTRPAGAHKNGLTAQYAATMPDKMGPYTRN